MEHLNRLTICRVNKTSSHLKLLDGEDDVGESSLVKMPLREKNDNKSHVES